MTTQQKPGFITQMKSFPPTFWVANTMEIFERMAWYGFFAVSSSYITGPKETGGLGFTSEQRGQLQAIVPFFLYLMPVVTGALADRYGYKRLFIIAYSCMMVFYYALGQFSTFPTFLMAFMLVAVAAAIFKPVVVGTVARVTNETNSGMGFGIFYMMVNIGGFVGPLVAGAVRGIDWKWVFIASSAWAAVNLIIVLIFYKDPSTESQSGQKRTLKKVASDMVEVLGNLRFGLCVFTVLIALMLANQEFEWFSWTDCGIFIAVWLAANLLLDLMLPAGSGNPAHPASKGRFFLAKRMRCSNWRFALFLLIMSGFWTSFQQIFITMPEYIRDFTDTKPMVNAGRTVFAMIGKPGWINGLAAIEETELLEEFDGLHRRAEGVGPMAPPEKEGAVPEEAAQKRMESAIGDLKALAANRKLEAGLRDQASAMAERLLVSDSKPNEESRNRVEAAETLVASLNSSIRQKEYAENPGISAEDRAKLEQLAARLNDSDATDPLTPVDLAEGAQTLLQYKVRITPVELATLLTQVPATSGVPSDDLLNTAVASINKRLEAKGKPPFADGAEAESLKSSLTRLVSQHGPLVPSEAVAEAANSLSSKDHPVEPAVLALGVRDLAYRPTIWARMDAGRQVNPEHIVNFDALAIVLLQVVVSFLMGKFHQFTTMIVGMVIAAVGIGLPFIGHGTMIGPVGGLLIVVILGIVIFAIGEMMASPTSQEYVGRIAPRDRVGVYMGYYFVAVALGNLFSGILSGQLYGKLARDMHRPDLMWLAFGGIMLLTAILFLAYDRFALVRSAPKPATAG